MKRARHCSYWAAVLGAFSLLTAAAPAFAQQAEDDRLNSFFETYLEEHFRQQPLQATSLGDHRFDDRLDDISPRAREGWLAFARKTLDDLPRQVAYKKLSRDGQIDFEIFRHNLQTEIWEAKNFHPFEEDPRAYGGYISDAVYLLLTQSTLPKETNLANAIRFMKEGADCVKLEGGAHFAETVRGMVRMGIPVMGHVGLTPQTFPPSAWRVQGKDVATARQIIEDAEALDAAGVCAIVLEAVPAPLIGPPLGEMLRAALPGADAARLDALGAG